VSQARILHSESRATNNRQTERLALTVRRSLRSLSNSRIKVIAIKIHHLVPDRHEVMDKHLPRVVTGIHFRNGPQLRVRPKHEIDGRAGPFDLTGLAVPSFEHVFAAGGLLPLRAHVQQVHEEVIGQRLRSLREDPMGGIADVGIQDPHAADQHRHLRSSQRQQVGPIHQQLLRAAILSLSVVIAEPVGDRFKRGKGSPFPATRRCAPVTVGDAIRPGTVLGHPNE
jgi:hypothetical protein